MGQRSDEIKKHIDTQRNELNDNLERLEERVKSTTDWRTHVEKRPMTALGIAFGGGLLLGSLIPITGRSSNRKYSSGRASTLSSSYSSSQGYTGSSEGSSSSYAEKSQKTRKPSATSRELRKTWNMIDTVRAAMISFGAAKLKDYLDSVIPGFGEHYNRTEREHRNEQGYSEAGMAGTRTAGTTGTQSPSYSNSTTGQR